MEYGKPDEEKGLSLIELMWVIVLVVILGGVINIGINSINSSRLNGAVRRLASDLRFAQQVAMTKRIRHGIIFTANSYTVFQNDNTADPARNPQGGNDFVLDFTTGDFAGVTISTDLSDSVVRFEPTGRPLEGAAPIALTAAKQVTLTFNGSPKSVTITPETGKVN